MIPTVPLKFYFLDFTIRLRNTLSLAFLKHYFTRLFYLFKMLFYYRIENSMEIMT